MNKKEFIFSLLKSNSIEDVLTEMRYCKEYSDARKANNRNILDTWDEEKYLFPDDIELTPEEIRQIINDINNLEGNYWQVEDVKANIVHDIFEHISDESKIEYFRSDEFLETTDIEDHTLKQLSKSALETIPREKHGRLFERTYKKTQSIDNTAFRKQFKRNIKRNYRFD